MMGFGSDFHYSGLGGPGDIHYPFATVEGHILAKHPALAPN
jgi:hypothetical protein